MRSPLTLNLQLPMVLSMQGTIYSPATPDRDPGKVSNERLYDEEPERRFFIRKAVAGELECTPEQLRSLLPDTPAAAALVRHWAARPELWVLVSGNSTYNLSQPIYRGEFPWEVEERAGWTVALAHTDTDVLVMVAELQQTALPQQANRIGKYMETLDRLSRQALTEQTPLSESCFRSVN